MVMERLDDYPDLELTDFSDVVVVVVVVDVAAVDAAGRLFHPWLVVVDWGS